MRVLLIDDEQFYLKLIQKKLEESDYELEYAKTGTEGLAKIQSFDPGVLIVDLKMPEMDGFEVLDRLQRNPKFSQIPVIVITAKDELSEKLKAFELGADDYLVKPFQPEELVARMGILTRRVKATTLLRDVVADRRGGATAARIAARFHHALAEATVEIARRAGCPLVALSGGCFQNRLLLRTAAARLRAAGFTPLVQRRVPPNDGGVSLGQIAVAAAGLRGGAL